MKYLKKIFVNDKMFYKQIFILALPIALQSLISVGVNMLDNMMVGQLQIEEANELGEIVLSAKVPMSAVSFANTFIGIYHILCMGLGMGASVLVSRYWGMRQKEPVRAKEALLKTVCIVVRITVSFALVFALATLFIPGTIMRMYTDNAGIIELGITYFRYSVVTYFFLGLSLVCTIVLRSVGQVKIPLFVSIGAFFINLSANYCLIFGHFGLPRMGVAGAALGTLIARIFEASVICGYLFFADKHIGFRLKHLAMKTGDLIGEYIKISIPVLISDGILALGNNAVAMVIGHLGTEFTAANSITAVTQQMSSVLVQGVCQAGAIVTGQTLGAGDKEKAQSQAYSFLGFGVGLGLLSAVFIMAASPFIIGSYEVEEATKHMAGQLMSAISLIIVFQSTNSIMTKGVLRGGGDTRMLMLADNIFLWVLSIPLGIIAGFVLKLSPFWIYVCLKFDQIAKSVWCVIRLRSGKWIKRINTAKDTEKEKI